MAGGQRLLHVNDFTDNSGKDYSTEEDEEVYLRSEQPNVNKEWGEYMERNFPDGATGMNNTKFNEMAEIAPMQTAIVSS